MTQRSVSTGKKVRRIAAIIYILVMLFIVGGTLLHQNNQENAPQSNVNGFSANPDIPQTE